MSSQGLYKERREGEPATGGDVSLETGSSLEGSAAKMEEGAVSDSG